MFPADALGQGSRPLSSLEQQYVDAFVALLKDWEAGGITFRRTDEVQDEFVASMGAFEQRQQFDVLEQGISGQFIAQRWEMLPDQVDSELPLTPGAYLVLAGGIADAVPQLSERGIEPDPEAIAHELEYPLYLTLGAAQLDTLDSGKSEIDAISIRRGGVWLFSFGWPFCCAAD